MVLPRRVKDKLQGLYGCKFEWLERKKEDELSTRMNKQNRIPRQRKTFYRGFKFGSCCVYEGDCVSIKMDNTFKCNSPDEIARVINCYDNGEERDSMKLIIQWYSRADDILKKHTKELAKDIPPIDYDIEVMKNYWGYNSEIDAETVSGICHVFEVPGHVDPRSVSLPSNVLGPKFVCRFNYFKKKPWLIPLVEQEVDFPSPVRPKKPLGDISTSALNILTPKSDKKPPTKEQDQVWGDIKITSPIVSIEKLSPHDVNKFHTPLRKSVKRKLLDAENNSPKRPRKELSHSFSPPSKENSEDARRFKENQSPPANKPEEASRTPSYGRSPLKEKQAVAPALSALKTLGHKSVLREDEISTLMADDGDDFEDNMVIFRDISIKVKQVKVNSFSPKNLDNGDEKTTPTSKRKVIRSRRYSESEFISPSPKAKRKLEVLKEESTEAEESASSPKEKQGKKQTRPAALRTPKEKTRKPPRKARMQEGEGEDSEDEYSPLKAKKRSSSKSKKQTDALRTPKGKSSKAVAAATSSPRTPKAGKRKACPSPAVPNRSTPVAKVQGQLEDARSQLHVSAVPSYLPCREDEFEQIYSFVEGKLSDQSGGCMYVSGVPGTGKTATVREIVKLVREQQESGSLPDFHMLEINAMKLSNPHQLWVQVWEGLMNEKVTADHARALLDKFFSCSMPKTKCVFLLLDELDLLWTRKQDVMYNLFDWSSRIGSKLVVVAIANTMDLPERMMMSRVSSRLGLTRMTFQPYTYTQLKEIIESRLKGIEAFDPDAVQFVSRKVAAVSGDARRALDICRRATEIAERAHSSLAPKSPSKSPRKRKGVVTMEHVSTAIEEMFTSPKIKAIKCCSEMEKYVLKAILAEFLRTGLEEATFRNALIQLESITRFEGVLPPSSSEALLLINRLSSMRIVLAEHSRLDFLMRIRLNVSSDDVSYALQG